MFHAGRFCREVSRPVSYRDAQLFRWVTVLYAFIPSVVMAVAAGAVYGLADVGGAWGIVSAHVGYFLFLAGATGVPSYWFHPPHLSVARQNRAITLSYYGSAALSLTPVTQALLTTMAMLWYEILAFDPFYGPLALVLGISLVALQPILWIVNLSTMAGHAAERSVIARIGFVPGLLGLWLVVGLLAVFGIPLVSGFYILLYLCAG